MTKSKLWVLPLCVWLSGCAASTGSVRDEGSEPEEVTGAEEACRARDALVFRCGQDEDGEACGFYRCRDVIFQEPVMTRGLGGGMGPQPAGSAMRWWGVRELPKTEPVFRIQWRQPPPPLCCRASSPRPRMMLRCTQRRGFAESIDDEIKAMGASVMCVAQWMCGLDRLCSRRG